jgi:hypothetical protein
VAVGGWARMQRPRYGAPTPTHHLDFQDVATQDGWNHLLGVKPPSRFRRGAFVNSETRETLLPKHLLHIPNLLLRLTHRLFRGSPILEVWITSRFASCLLHRPDGLFRCSLHFICRA